MAGEIVSVGDAVEEWTVGDRVSANFVLDHLEGYLKPEMLESSPGASLNGILTEYGIFIYAALAAFNALRGLEPVKSGNTDSRDRFAPQLAVVVGVETSSSDETLLQAEVLGAMHTLNYKMIPEWDAETRKLTNGVGVDLILQLRGCESVSRSMNAARMSATIAIIVNGIGDETHIERLNIEPRASRPPDLRADVSVDVHISERGSDSGSGSGGGRVSGDMGFVYGMRRLVAGGLDGHLTSGSYRGFPPLSARVLL
ncbi:hypothetical protein DFH09DRAFT_1078978 [Mycena vulgaris]|nr:hypothetical protein DFH09DRAFT_1078978 [Mycena vulgaris]